MEANRMIIGAVVVGGLALIIYLFWKNQKDGKEVIEYFNEESSVFQEDESELNDEK